MNTRTIVSQATGDSRSAIVKRSQRMVGLALAAALALSALMPVRLAQARPTGRLAHTPPVASGVRPEPSCVSLTFTTGGQAWRAIAAHQPLCPITL